jgi:hypothetical protein
MSEHQVTEAAADEPVDIAHLVATAVQQQQQQDPLPTAEEIEAAKQASVAAAAHSTCSAAAVPGQPVKGLGGAGLHPKRGKGGRGPGSTISAATAPPTLAVPGGGVSAAAGMSGLGVSSNSSSRKEAPAAGSSSAGASFGDEPASSGSGGSRALPAKKDAAGVRSFKTVVSPSAHDEGSEWESASSEEVRRRREALGCLGLTTRGLREG